MWDNCDQALSRGALEGVGLSQPDVTATVSPQIRIPFSLPKVEVKA